MLKPFSLFVGLRYSIARKRNFLLSFVSLISMLGVSLGVMILIVALAVINGSIDTLRGEALKSVPHVTLSAPDLNENWQSLAAELESNPEILAVAPYIEAEAVLRHQGVDRFVQLRGIMPGLESAVLDSASSHQLQQLELLAEVNNGMVLGTQLAAQLGIFGRGEVSATALDNLLRRDLSVRQAFEAIGFADFGVYGNANIALVNLAQARELFASAELKLRVRVSDVLRAGEIVNASLAGRPDVEVLPWNEAEASLFNALNMEKVLTGFMLLMIVLIGAINIISTLVMVVADKGADIAILRTMGASRRAILVIFVIQGMIAGVFGTVLGSVLGVVLANNISAISLWLEQLINSMLADANVYLLSHLDTQVLWNEVLLVCAAALLISFLATLYPAYRASKVQPAEVLRYE